MDLGDVRVVEAGQPLRLALEPGEAIGVINKASGRIFSATWRLSWVSVACQTCPMAPSPMRAVTSGPHLFDASQFWDRTLGIHNAVMHNTAMVDRELVAATSKALILSILNEGDSYGYEIIQRVHALTENELKWTDSMLYPVLHRLEKQGCISPYWQASPTGRQRKYYSISRDGLAELEEKKRQWRVANDALTSLWEPA
jgi:PadR family transcriptional regulator PadR